MGGRDGGQGTVSESVPHVLDFLPGLEAAVAGLDLDSCVLLLTHHVDAMFGLELTEPGLYFHRSVFQLSTTTTPHSHRRLQAKF